MKLFLWLNVFLKERLFLKIRGCRVVEQHYARRSAILPVGESLLKEGATSQMSTRGWRMKEVSDRSSWYAAFHSTGALYLVSVVPLCFGSRFWYEKAW